ncbi:hypothetical protein Q73_14010 [Bacillus coahuilensis m2-6]|nr:DUF2812 domain-containing protein [Bacillus coahuilensis]KUP04952.1 hypothetical protein Q73_14010 [Bacillus coahuilensis m2-6]
MQRLRYFMDLDKEEEWLNEKAKEGNVLYQKSFFYHFKATTEKDPTVKLDYRTFKHREDFEDYIALFEDSGWKHIAGSKRSGVQYFQRVSNEATGDIFSDSHSKAERYKRYAQTSASLLFTYFILLIGLMSADVLHLQEMLQPKSLYYTPGLWEKEGADFWRAFLFETPYAFFRGFAWLLFPIAIVIFFLSATISYIKYEKLVNQ